MNALETFLAALPCGFLTDETLPKLQQLDRLFPVLVRCHSYRFTTPAQDAAKLIALVGDQLRDVSIPAGMDARARAWVRENPVGSGLAATGLISSGLVAGGQQAANA